MISVLYLYLSFYGVFKKTLMGDFILLWSADFCLKFVIPLKERYIVIFFSLYLLGMVCVCGGGGLICTEKPNIIK